MVIYPRGQGNLIGLIHKIAVIAIYECIESFFKTKILKNIKMHNKKDCNKRLLLNFAFIDRYKRLACTWTLFEYVSHQ